MTPVQMVHGSTQAEIDKLLAEYGTDRKVLEVRHLEAIDRILDATTLPEAEALVKKAIAKIHVTLLTKAGKQIRGKLSVDYFSEKVDGAEYWAERQEKKAAEAKTPKERERALKYAKKQRDKAERLRAEERLYKEGKWTPQFVPPPPPPPKDAVKPKKTKRLTVKPTKRKRA
jgi:hypothetical protein